MKIRYATSINEFSTMNTEALRDTFLIDSLFARGEISLEYCEIERTIVGSAVPTKEALRLEAGKELDSEYFCQRRELGVFNIGGQGSVLCDDKVYTVENLDCVYIGRNTKNIRFQSANPNQPAKFYLLSYPAHTAYPSQLIKKSDAKTLHLGDQATSNKRTIFQYIHEEEGGAKSCQLVMGFTQLHEGNVWNTMPPHTHQRRTEVYLYFNLDNDNRVFHFMGPGNQTKHLLLNTDQAVISPMWSIHSGCGTGAYAFCWGMGGENQRFGDMDGISMSELR